MEHIEWHRQTMAERTAKALTKNGFDTIRVSSKEEATARILEMIPEGAAVGFGGSVTVRQLNLPAELEKRGHKLADHWVARASGASLEEVTEVRRQQMNSDVFITSTNAVTESGEFVNIDGGGQRVAAMIFGPKKVIIVTGTNKIVKDADAAVDRARNTAAAINAHRLGVKTPCAQTGICTDCDSKERICNITTVLHRAPPMVNATVVLVDEPLGY
jgi:hypothetical protein